MPNELNPGSKVDLGASTMAMAMVEALMEEWPKFNGDRPLPEGEALQGLQLMFVAVAQGVVKHLHENPGAFVVTTGSASPQGVDGAHSHDADVVEIKTT